MGGKIQLYRRSSLIFFFIGVVALGLQVASALLPFWFEDNWQASSHLSDGSDTTAFRVFQGLWSDYSCKQVVMENVKGSNLHSKITGYADCRIQLHDEGGEATFASFSVLRGLVVASMALGFLSSLGALGVFVSARRKTPLHVLSRICLTLASLVAGLCSVMVVLIVAGALNPRHLSWALSLPTLAGVLWFFNGSFSFVVCRYRPGYNGTGFDEDYGDRAAVMQAGEQRVSTVAATEASSRM